MKTAKQKRPRLKRVRHGVYEFMGVQIKRLAPRRDGYARGWYLMPGDDFMRSFRVLRELRDYLAQRERERADSPREGA